MPEQDRPLQTSAVDNAALLDLLHTANPNAAIFTAVHGFPNTATTFIPTPTQDMQRRLPLPLLSLFHAKNRAYTKAKLTKMVKQTSIIMSEAEALFVEEATRGQSSSSLWYDHRVGRVTASLFGRATRCKEKVYPTSLVKEIMQHTKPNSCKVPSLAWGIENEKTARYQYQKTIEVNHQSFCIRPAGLLLSSAHPSLQPLLMG